MPKNSQQKQLEQIAAEIAKCAVCSTAGKGKLVPGEGSSNADVIFVGEAPGKQEVITGRPFIGRAGKVLRELIASMGLATEDVFITSAVKYLPKNYVTPKQFDIEHGRTHLYKQLKVIKPKVIVLLGNVAAQSVLNQKFYIAKQHGEFISQDGLLYFISYHPAAPLYSPKLREVIFKDFKKLKRKL